MRAHGISRIVGAHRRGDGPRGRRGRAGLGFCAAFGVVLASIGASLATPQRVAASSPTSTPQWASAVSTQQYALANSDGSTWVEMDPTKLTATLSPSVSEDAVVSGNVDLWTANAGYNQDIGIFVSENGDTPTLLAWKESGGFAGTSSPNAAFVQTVYAMTSGNSYVFSLWWKTNKPALGATIYAGAGPIGSAYSPARLTAYALPTDTTQWATAVSTAQYTLANSGGSTWVEMDPTKLTTTLSPSVAEDAVISGNADLWTANAGYNQDIGIFVTDNGGPATLLAWKESGGFAGTFSPNAAFVETVYPMTAGHSYVFSLWWKTNKNAPGATIYAGAGPIGTAFSPTRLTAYALPTDTTQWATAVSTEQYTLASSDGSTWVEMDPTKLTTTLSPSVAEDAVISGNADLWTANAGYNQDIGIFVTDNGGPATLLAWKESGGFAGTFSPNAAFVETVYPMTAGHSYVFSLWWKTNKNAPGATIYAGAGPIGSAYSPTRLTALALPTEPQTISFTAPSSGTVNGSALLAPTASSGLTVVLTVDASTTNDACSLSGDTVNYLHAGSCVLDANQAGNADYGAAPQVQRTITVGPGTQSITFTAPSSGIVTGSYLLAPTASSGLTVALTVDASTTNSACSLSGDTVNYLNAGSCVIDANQAGDADYSAAPQVQQTITVVPLWSTTSIDSGVPLASVSCTSDTFCMAVGGEGPGGAGYALSYNGSTWSTPTLIDSGGPLSSVSCTSDTFCMAVDWNGDAMSYDGSTWSAATLVDSVGPGNLGSVSCTSDTFCMAVDWLGYALSYDGSTWSTPMLIDSNEGLTSVSCTSSTFCMAVDYNGNSQNAFSYDGSGWSVTSGGPAEGLSGVSCTSSTFCMVAAYSSDAVSYSGSGWSSITPTDPSATGDWATVSCSGSSFCMLVDDPGDAAVYDSSGWSPAANIDSSTLDSVSCVNSSFCMAVDGAGNALTYRR